jgi:hypothetical protein
MYRFYQYTRSGKALLILAGLALLQSCSELGDINAEPLSKFEKNFGMARKFDEVALQQSEEYGKTGKFSSTLNLNVQCYKSYSNFSSAHDAVTNFAIQKPCSDVDYNVENYMSKIFVVANVAQRKSKVVEVRCSTAEYPISAFKNGDFSPRLAYGKFPECPQDSKGNNILPLYRDYSLPRERLGLSDRKAIVQALDQISDQQVQEFTKSGQYSSALSFNSECGTYVSSVFDDGKTIINWITPRQNCSENLSDDIRYSEFVSAVFSIKDEKNQTVKLSRVVCEVKIGEPVDFAKQPPRLVNGVPVCTTGESNSVKKILTKQYPPVPTR